MKNSRIKWLLISLCSLLVVAFLGALMRYKIAFYLPWIEQKNLQHAHSHFAFAGWLTQILFVILIARLEKKGFENAFSEYRNLLVANLGCSYGMLISFWCQGYSFISIALSTMSIFIYFLFAFQHRLHLNLFARQEPATNWIKASLFFGILSSAGTFFLAYMMASNQLEQHLYLGSVYFYLHFQYNGWFLFACLGILIGYLSDSSPEFRIPKVWVQVMVVSTTITYGLSVLWASLPSWLYWVLVGASVGQTLIWFLLVRKITLPTVWKSLVDNKFLKFIYCLICICVSIKFLLQLGSVIPEVSRLAFGFRPIVISYLHLILLSSISSFLVAFVFSTSLLPEGKRHYWVVFFGGLYLNQLVLGIHGIASFTYIYLPYINEILFGLSVVLVLGFTLALQTVKKNLQESAVYD
ncbi:MAG TPA: hypothetical protein PK509_11210 [Catalimonadaceae bacterium]|nr:hypothetical protein [Catalimonadaceae bacterium]HPI10269.1 hypothetical protein [Catalimonadaceae bacterium]